MIRKYFSRLRAVTRLVICSGNHDLDSPNETGEKVAKWLGQLAERGRLLGRRVLPARRDSLHRLPVVGRADHAGGHRGAARRGRARRDRKLWIWIHHAPPDKSPTSWGGARYFGDAELAQWIVEYQPDIVLSGHVHQSPFVTDGSWVDRIGRPGCSMPVSNSARRRRISSSTPRPARRCGSLRGQSVHPPRASRSSGRCRGSKAIPDWLKAEDRPHVPGRA